MIAKFQFHKNICGNIWLVPSSMVVVQQLVVILIGGGKHMPSGSAILNQSMCIVFEEATFGLRGAIKSGEKYTGFGAVYSRFRPYSYYLPANE